MIDDYVIESVDREIVVQTVGQQAVIEAGALPVVLQPAGFDGLIPFINQVARDAAIAAGHFAPAPIIVTVKPNGGDYASPQTANEGIKDAGPAKRYKVRVWANSGDGSWSINEFAPKPYIEWEAVGPDRVLLRGYQAPNTSPALVEANSALRLVYGVRFTGFRITAQNMRYVWHADDPAMLGQAPVFFDCELDHLGNQQAIDWQTANNGAPAAIWRSDCVAGIGMMPGTVIRFENCLLRARRNAILCHTLNPPDWPTVDSNAGGRLELINCATERREANAEAVILQSFASGHRHVFLTEGTRFQGVIDGSVQVGTAKEWVAVGHAPAGTVITAAIPSQVTIY